MINNRVVVLGASDKTHRYSYKAVKLLKEKGYSVIPVNPNVKSISELKVFPSLDDLEEPVDTISVYLSPDNLITLISKIIEIHPRRVILNPGSGTYAIEQKLVRAGILVEQDCTLIMLSSNTF